MKRTPPWSLVLLGVALALGPQAPLAQTLEAEGCIARFLSGVQGEWVGRAQTTPIGPRRYDISFAETTAGTVDGQAQTGASTHYWSFFNEAGNLRIRFLSTFGGNQEPIFLDVAKREVGGILFRAARLPLLSVRVFMSAERLDIDVFHWNEPHVEIRLARPDML